MSGEWAQILRNCSVGIGTTAPHRPPPAGTRCGPSATAPQPRPTGGAVRLSLRECRNAQKIRVRPRGRHAWRDYRPALALPALLSSVWANSRICATSPPQLGRDAIRVRTRPTQTDRGSSLGTPPGVQECQKITRRRAARVSEPICVKWPWKSPTMTKCMKLKKFGALVFFAQNL